MKTINYTMKNFVMTFRRINLIVITMILTSIISKGQIPTYSNGIANTTSGGNSIPFSFDNLGKRGQLLFPSGASFGNPAPGQMITKIYFAAYTPTIPVATTYTNFTLKMGNTSLTTLSGTWVTAGMTTVLTAPSITINPQSSTWFSFTLATPFVYDPSQNLIVDIEYCGITAASNWFCATLSPAQVYSRQYNTGLGCGQPTPSTFNTFAGFYFGFDAVPTATCSVPTAQPTGLTTSSTITSISASFTAASPAPNSYLVVQYPAGTTPTDPVDGVNYSAGSTLGAGTVVQNSSSTSFSITGLPPGTSYDFYIYSMNGITCYPNLFLTTSPLFGTLSTTACPGWSGVRTVGPTGFYPDLTTALADIIEFGINGPAILELQAAYDGSAEPMYPIVIGPSTLEGNICIGPINSLTIRPEAGASSLAITSSNSIATVLFDGGKYVTIDGRPGGLGSTSQLSIQNTSATGNAIQMKNETSLNIIKYCDLQGQNTNLGTAGTPSGVVFIGGTIGANGNDNNLITNCDIHETAGGFPTLGLYSYNSSAALAAQNHNNTINACNVFNFYNATASSTGIKIEAGNNNWVITDNNIYQTAPRNYTSAVAHRGLWVTPNTGSLTSASGHVITGNFIGGANTAHSGVYTMTGAVAYIFDAMDISVGLGAATSVQNNTIANISMTAATTSTLAFVGINLANGNVNVGDIAGNTIGSSTVNGSIAFTTTSSGGGFMGIRATSGAGAYNISNNTISGVDVSSSLSSGSAALTGINTLIGNPLTVSNNIIGGTLVNSLQVTTIVSGAATMNGILNSASAALGSTISGNTIRNLRHNNASTGGCTLFGYQGTAGANVSVIGNTISDIGNTITTSGISNITGISQSTNTIHNINNNTVFNLTSLSTSTSGQVRGIVCTNGQGNLNGNTIRNNTTSGVVTGIGISSGMVGIVYQSTTAGIHTVSGNTIHSLTNNSTSTTASTQITGLAFSASATTTITYNIEKNNIHSLDVTALDPNARITGMDFTAGVYNCRNNMVRLGLKPNGTSLISPRLIIGINSLSTALGCNIWNNSVFIGGTGVNSTNVVHSRAFTRATTAGTYDVSNNIFVNARSNSAGTGKHYSIFLAGIATLTLNNNLYDKTGTGGVFATNNNGTTDFANYSANWGGTADANSFQGNPQFLNPTGTSVTGDLHINTSLATLAESGAINIAGLTDDFDGDIRFGNAGYAGTGGAPDIGADEFDGVPGAPVLTAFTLNPAAQCIATSHTVTVDATTGSGTITGVSLTYSFNGGAPTTIAMSFVSGNTWSAVIPAATPTDATVTWSVAATSSLGFSKQLAGPSYKDEPMTGISGLINTSTNTLCVGTPVTLSAFSIVPGATYQWFSGATPIGTGSSLVYTPTLPGTETITFIGTDPVSGCTFASGGSGAQLTYEQTFTNGIASPAQCTAFTAFQSAIPASPFYTQVTISGTFNTTGIVCTDPAIVNAFALAVKTSATYISALTGGHVWSGCNRGSYYEIWIDPVASCSGSNCPNPGYIIRPCIGNLNWGGVNTATCTTNPTQVMKLEFLSAGSPTVELTVLGGPSAPTATNSAHCGTQIPTASVTSTSLVPTPVFSWYDTPSGGTLLQTGTSNTFLSMVNATTTFYVEEYDGTCGSYPRTAVTVTVTPAPAITITENPVSSANTCGFVPITLTASSSAGYDYSWSPAATLSASTGSSVIATAGATETYTVVGFESGSGCGSSASVTIMRRAPDTVNPTASPALICAGGTSQLNAGTFIGGQLSTPIISGNTFAGNVFDISATNTVTLHKFSMGITAGTLAEIWYKPGGYGCTTSLTSSAGWILAGTNIPITPAGAAPNLTLIDFDVNVTIPMGQTYGWVVVCNGSNYYTNGTAVCTPLASDANITFYQGLGGSAYTGGTGVGFNFLNFTRNFNGNVTYSFGNPSLTFAWTPTASLDNASVETPVATPSATTTYTCVITDPPSGCTNSGSVTVTVNQYPPAPTASAANSVCGTGVVNLSATGTGGTLRWFDVPTGGTPLATGSAYSPTINTTTSFYVEEVSEANCIGPRASVVAVSAAPAAVTVTNSIPVICDGALTPSTLTASSANGNYTYAWTPAVGLTPSNGLGASVTALPGSTTIYTLTATDNTVSPACVYITTTTVGVGLTPVVTSVTASPAAVCSGSPATLSANAITQGIFTQSGFAGAFAPNTWTFSEIPVGTGGSVDASPAPSSIVITSGNNGFGGTTRYSHFIAVGGTITFDWSYTTVDGPQWDLPQYSLNGFSIDFETAGFGYNTAGSATQSGTASIAVGAGQTFALEMFTVDGGFGSAQITISNIVFPTTAAITYSWTPSAELNTSAGATVIATPNTAGLNVYTVTASNEGCTATGSVTVDATATPPAPACTSVNICGSGVANLSATGTGGTLKWLNAQGGPIAATGATYSPAVTATSNYYVYEEAGAMDTSVGPVATFYTQAANFGTTDYVLFDVMASGGIIINTVQILTHDGSFGFPQVPAGTPIVIALENNLGQPVGDPVATVTGAAGGIPHNITLNLFVPQGTGWRLRPLQNPVMQVGDGFFPQTIPGVISITGIGGPANPAQQYRWFYDWHITKACNSALCQSTVTVTPAPALTITPSGPTTFCGSGSVNLTAGGSPGWVNFSWSPATGLSATTGATVTANLNTPGEYKYTLTADDGVIGGCMGTQTITVIVHPAPDLTIDPPPAASLCPGVSFQFNATASSASEKQFGSSHDPAGIDISPYNGINVVRTQIMYTAAELNAAGLIGPGNITSIAFEIAGKTTSGSYAGFSIGMAQTITAPPLTGYLTPAFTTVFAGTVTTTLGWNTYDFTTPFAWDGTSNIIVNICNGSTAGGVDQVYTSPTTLAQTVTPNFTLCTNVTATVTVNRPNTRLKGGALLYNWTPSTGLSSTSVPDPFWTNPGVGSYVYTLLVTDAATNCTASGSISFDVQSAPVPVVEAVSNTALCYSGIPSMRLVGLTPAVLQWQRSLDGINFNDIIGANNSNYTAATITNDRYYRMRASCGGPDGFSNILLFHVDKPAIASTTPSVPICGFGEVCMSATVNIPGYSVNWYTAPSGGTSVANTASGANFCPVINTTTTFYAAATTVSSSPVPYFNYTANVGSNSFPFNQTAGKKVQWFVAPGEFVNPSAAPAGNYITRISFFASTTGTATYANFEIKLGQTSTAFAGGSMYAGSLTSVILPSTRVISATANNWVTLLLDLPFAYDPAKWLVIDVSQCGYTGTGFSVYQNTLTGTRRTWSAGGCPFAWSSNDATLPGITLDLSPAAAIPCESARVPVIAVSNPAPAITVTSAQDICEGASAAISASSANSGYTYLWNPGNLSGASQTVSPAGTTTYTVIASDNSSGPNDGCNISATTTVTVKPNPVITSIGSNSPLCAGGTLNLDVSANTPGAELLVALFSENWSSSSFATNLWTFDPSQSNWTVGTSYTPLGGTAPNAFFNWTPSITNYSFSLVSKVLDGTASVEVKLNYLLHLDNFSTATLEQFKVEYKKTSDLTWTLLENFTNTLGGIQDWARVDQVLVGMAGSNFQIRFTAYGGNSFNINGWGLDNIVVNGIVPSIIFAWSGPNGFTDNVEDPSIPLVTAAATGTYSVVVTDGPTGCTSTGTTEVQINTLPQMPTLQSATLNGGIATAFPPQGQFLEIPVFTESLTCDKVVNYDLAISGIPAPDVDYIFGGATVGSGTGTGSGSTFERLIPTGRTTVVVNATNVCGSSPTRTFRVLVTDNVPPVITPIPVAPSNTNGGDCFSLVQVTAPTLGNGLFDNCPNPSVILIGRSDGLPTEADPYMAGTTTLTWQATDASSNVSTATQNVVVTNIKPVITSFTSSEGNLIFVGGTTTFTVTFTDEDGGGPHLVKFYRDKNDATPASIRTVARACSNGCVGLATYSSTSEQIQYNSSEVAEPKVEVLDGCNLAADQEPGVSTLMYLAVAVAGSQFTTAGGHFIVPTGATNYEGFNASIGNVVKKATNGNNFKGQLELNIHIPNLPDWRVHTDNGTNTDITWDYLTIGGCSLATFRGSCRVNGQTGYKVLVQQTDKDRNPSTSNLIRVKVTTNSGVLIFDTQPGLTEALTSGNGGAAAIITQLTNGSIKVQPANNCVSRADDIAAGEILQNMPNPFTGQTEIRFTVPQDGMYTLMVYNYLGQEVATLFNGEAAQGSVYSVIFDGSNLEPGIYTYTLIGADISRSQRMSLVK